MNTKNATFYHLILDKSGSMSTNYDQTLSGLNEKFLAIKNIQKQNPEIPIYVSLTLFSSTAKTVFENRPASELPVMKARDYVLDGMTALCDAMGKVIKGMQFHLGDYIANDGADAVVVVFTDGYENDSRHYSYAEIGGMVKELQGTKKWEFTFYGADIDAWDTASKMNFHQSNVYSSKAEEVKGTMRAMSLKLDNYVQVKKSTIFKK